MELVGFELLWLRRYTHEAPGLFLALLHEESDVVSGALLKLRDWYLSIEEAEDQLTEDHIGVRSALEQVPWLTNPWIREIFIGLQEADWKTVPMDIVA